MPLFISEAQVLIVEPKFTLGQALDLVLPQFGDIPNDLFLCPSLILDFAQPKGMSQYDDGPRSTFSFQIKVQHTLMLQSQILQENTTYTMLIPYMTRVLFNLLLLPPKIKSELFGSASLPNKLIFLGLNQ